VRVKRGRENTLGVESDPQEPSDTLKGGREKQKKK
jgi:hypothetical protein